LRIPPFTYHRADARARSAWQAVSLTTG
jgi:hypothetical protein